MIEILRVGNLKKYLSLVFLFFVIGHCESKLIFGQLIQKTIIEKGNNCAANNAYFDYTRSQAKTYNANIIIIARLGDGEFSNKLGVTQLV